MILYLPIFSGNSCCNSPRDAWLVASISMTKKQTKVCHVPFLKQSEVDNAHTFYSTSYLDIVGFPWWNWIICIIHLHALLHILWYQRDILILNHETSLNCCYVIQDLTMINLPEDSWLSFHVERELDLASPDGTLELQSCTKCVKGSPSSRDVLVKVLDSNQDPSIFQPRRNSCFWG